MNHIKAGQIWNENAANWTKLIRMGCDLYRDHVNTPAFLSMLPDVNGLKGLDIGCGEGDTTRQVVKRGATMTGIDICPVFIEQAEKLERQKPLGIEYKVASAVEPPFKDGDFDFAVATMSLMDIPETRQVIKEAWRIIKQGGFLQFSINHPCFSTPKWEWIHDEKGRPVSLKCGDYFRELNGQIEEWMFGAAPDQLRNQLPKFKIPVFTRTLSKWLNTLITTGFVLEEFAEPHADDSTLEKYPNLADTRVIAYFLIIRCRKA